MTFAGRPSASPVVGFTRDVALKSTEANAAVQVRLPDMRRAGTVF